MSARLVAAAGMVVLGSGAVASPPSVRPAIQPVPRDRDSGLVDVPVADRDDVKIVEQRGGKIPLDLVFRNEQGAVVPLSDYFGDKGGHRPVVVILMYFRCPLMCPQTISSLMNAVNGADLKLGEDYNCVLVSFDPTEGPAEAAVQREGVIAQYRRELSPAAEKGLAVLTETAGNARKLANALGFGYKYMPVSNEYSHMNVGFVLTKDGTISQYLKGVNYGGETLKYAVIEAGEGRVGDLLDRAALWCMVIDPVTGRYQLSAKRVMQVGGALSAIAVLGVVAFAVRADRRRRVRHIARAASAAQPFSNSTVYSGGTSRLSESGLTS